MRKKTRRLNLHREQAGDTLISIILSVAVISLVIVIAYILISNSLRLSQQAREREQVKNVLQAQIEGLKYLAFNDGDLHVFHAFNNPNPEPFCLVDAPTGPLPPSSHILQISALALDDSTYDPLSTQSHDLVPADPSERACVKFSSLEAAEVKVWIIYDPQHIGDPTKPDEHLFTVRASWSGVRGGEENMVVALRLPPPET